MPLLYRAEQLPTPQPEDPRRALYRLTLAGHGVELEFLRKAVVGVRYLRDGRIEVLETYTGTGSLHRHLLTRGDDLELAVALNFHLMDPPEGAEYVGAVAEYRWKLNALRPLDP